ncbi:MAG: polyhydroxyalkanoate synthesis regulator DNA-binding domain-containing protein [Myxococcales bacterium]|nr:MAG: polyhydroxyalkanoate synthesis regulator DNA-binding domain-containing protein [Myxococcales bacterium]
MQDGAENGPSAKRIIKRYANRKLYDTRESRYITLAQVAEYVRKGEDIRIVDNKSKEDLTSMTLAQVIYYEEEKKGGDVRRDQAIGSLRSLIQSEGQRLVASIRDKAASKFSGVRPEAASDSTEDQRAKRSVIAYPKEIFEDVHKLVDERMRQLVASAISPVHQLQAEVKRLASRIEELEGHLKSVAEGRVKGSSEKAPELPEKGE